MSVWWTILLTVLWLFMFLEGLLLFGILRHLGILQDRIDTLGSAATTSFAAQGLEIGAHAPDFALPRIGGGQLALSDFQGKSVLLAFVRPGCQPCESLLSQLNTFVTRSGESSLQVLVISAGEIEDNERLVVEHSLLAPMVVQQGKEVADKYKAPFTPYVYVVDAHGVVRARGRANTRAQIEQMLASAEQSEDSHGEVDRERRTVRSEADGLHRFRDAIPRS